MKIQVASFSGLAPKISPSLLPNAGGQVAKNVKLISGSLKPINTPSKLFSGLVSGTKSAYLLGAPGTAIPLSWAVDTDVAPSPIADAEYRIYTTDGSTPKKTTLAMATAAGAPYTGSWYNLGVPGPTSAPAAAVTAGANVPTGTYTYIYTYVTLFGTVLTEESAHSPPVIVTVTAGANQAVALTGLANPASTTNYNFQYKRIYRTTGTAFQLVAQVAIATTSYTDNLAPTSILGDPLLTVGWLPPPADLQGITTLPNSSLVGFRNNEVWFSEPGFPHAWPVAYMQAMDTAIVGLGTFGNTVVVCTQAFPYAASGVHPDSFTFAKLPFLEPCLAKRSIASDEFGVLYASANGLVAVGNDANGVITAPFITRDNWADFDPATFTSAVFNRRYYGFYDSATKGAGGVVFARGDEAPFATLDRDVTAVVLDKKTARLLFVSKSDNYLYDYDTLGNLPESYTWKSKLFQSPRPINLGCFRIIGAEDSADDIALAQIVAALNAAITASNASLYALGNLQSELNAHGLNGMALNDSALKPLIPAVIKTIGVTVWAGKNIRLQGNFEFNRVYRLPSGYMTLGWEIGVMGQREVLAVEMAISPQELAGG